MDEPSVQVASALARVERAIIDFTAGQRQIQHSITQLRREVVDGFASHKFESRRLPSAADFSQQENIELSHKIESRAFSSAKEFSPQERFESSGRESNSSVSRSDKSYSNFPQEAVSTKNSVRQTGGDTAPLQADVEEVDFEWKVERDERNLATFLQSVHGSRRMIGDSGDFAVDVTQTFQSILDANWPTTLTVRPCWETLPSGTDVSLRVMPTMQISRNEQIQKNKEVKEPEKVLIPGSLTRLILDLMGITLLIWELAFTPLQIAWNLSIEGWLFVMSIGVSSFWTVDILFSSRTAYYRATGDLETRPWQVLVHYLRRQFLLDLFVVGADWISYLVESFPGALSLARITKVTRLVRLFRVARLLRVVRLTRLNELEDTLNSYGIGRPLVETLKIVLFTAFLTHVLSCLWFIVGNTQSSDTGYHWVGATWAESSPNFLNTPISFQYSSALQWTLSTMISGTSSILALNSTEQLISCCVILTGLLFQAFVVSILSAVAVESKERQRYLATTLSSLSKFCNAHKVSKQAALIARSQTRAAATRKAKASLSVKDVDGLQKIASKVRTMILFEVFEPHLSRHGLFYFWSQVEKGTCSKVFNGAMDFIYVHSGMDIFSANETATGAYLLSRGRANYVQDPQVSKVTETTTVEVILDMWLAEAALWTDWLHVGTLEAVSDECEICCLSFDAFLIAIQSSTKIKDVIGAYAKEYQQRLVKAVPPSIPWPSDLGTLGDEFMQILPGLPDPVRKAFAFMALDFATRMDLISDAQLELLTDEILKGKSDVVLVKIASQPSLHRLVSVIRVSVTRDDGSMFVHLGKLQGETFAPKCEFPGAKILDSEDIGTMADRIIKTLMQHIDNIVFQDCGIVDEFGTSHKTLLPTCYSIINVSYVSSTIGGCQSLNSTYACAKPRRKTYGQLIRRYRRHNTNEVAIEHKLRRHSERIRVEYENGETFICMWMKEAEIEFLKSKDGVTLLQSLSNEGVLQRQDAPDMRLGSLVFSADETVGSDVIEQEAASLPSAPPLTQSVQQMFV